MTDWQTSHVSSASPFKALLNSARHGIAFVPPFLLVSSSLTASASDSSRVTPPDTSCCVWALAVRLLASKAFL